jgi:hypothetical protein
MSSRLVIPFIPPGGIAGDAAKAEKFHLNTTKWGFSPYQGNPTFSTLFQPIQKTLCFL